MKLRINRLTALMGAVAVAGLGLSDLPAAASTATGQFTVSATVVATCIVSGSTLAFGNYSGSAINAQTTVSVTCTNGTSYNVGLNAGTASGATVTARAMTGPSSATLNYAMYQNNTHTTNWGNTVGTDTVAGTGNGSAQSLTVYGVLAASQYPTPGSYSDTITATVTY